MAENLTAPRYKKQYNGATVPSFPWICSSGRSDQRQSAFSTPVLFRHHCRVSRIPPSLRHRVGAQ